MKLKPQIPKERAQEMLVFFLTSNNYHASIPRHFYIKYFKVSWYNLTRSEQSNEISISMGRGQRLCRWQPPDYWGKTAQGHRGGLMNCVTGEFTHSSLSDLSTSISNTQLFSLAVYTLSFNFFCCSESDVLTLEWANHLKLGNIVGALKTAFSF